MRPPRGHTGRLNLHETLETHCFDQSYLSNLPDAALCYVLVTAHFQCLAVHQVRTEMQKGWVLTNDHSNSTTCVVDYQAKANITSETLGHNVSAEASKILSTFSYA